MGNGYTVKCMNHFEINIFPRLSNTLTQFHRPLQP